MRILLNVSLILIALGWAWWLKGQLNINWWQGRYGRGDADFIQQHSRIIRWTLIILTGLWVVGYLLLPLQSAL